MYYSQYGQDKFIANLYNNKHNGVFIDIGSNDGITISNTYYLEKNLNWKGLCIEPLPNAFKLLEKNRISININAAISDKNEISKFTCIQGESEMLSGLSIEYDARHLSRIDSEVNQLNQNKFEIDVQCVLFNDIVKLHNFKDIDYLSIDTEGNELKILRSIDFNYFNIGIIGVENNYNDGEYLKFLSSVGFYLYHRLGCDEIYLNKNFKF